MNVFNDMHNRSGKAYVNILYFFFQAEYGIRDTSVTGVQTCALPISLCQLARVLGGAQAACNAAVGLSHKPSGSGGFCTLDFDLGPRAPLSHPAASPA